MVMSNPRVMARSAGLGCLFGWSVWCFRIGPMSMSVEHGPDMTSLGCDFWAGRHQQGGEHQWPGHEHRRQMMERSETGSLPLGIEDPFGSLPLQSDQHSDSESPITISGLCSRRRVLYKLVVVGHPWFVNISRGVTLAVFRILWKRREPEADLEPSSERLHLGLLGWIGIYLYASMHLSLMFLNSQLQLTNISNWQKNGPSWLGCAVLFPNCSQQKSVWTGLKNKPFVVPV